MTTLNHKGKLGMGAKVIERLYLLLNDCGGEVEFLDCHSLDNALHVDKGDEQALVRKLKLLHQLQ
jgi:hypothetical protein